MKNKWLVSVVMLALLSVSAAAQHMYVSQPGNGALFSKDKEKSAPVHKEKLAQQGDFAMHQGNIIVSGQLGMAIPTSEIGKIDGVDFDETYGKTGISYGVQGLFALTDYISLGLEFNGVNFGSKDVRGENAWYYYDVDGFKVRQEQYMVAGRVYINPAERVRVYVPLGIGLAHTNVKIAALDAKESDSSFALYAGLGVEGSLSEHIVVGLEGRFNQSKFDKDGYNENIQYVNILARIGYKF